MGADPKTSAVNKYLQSWDVPNVFVIGASAFPQNAGYNPTGTVGALAFRRRRRDHHQISQSSRPAGADHERPWHARRQDCRAWWLRCLRHVPFARSICKPTISVERGRYLATAADCAACHTKPGGKPFAGGVALETPFGTLVGPNITPDPDAGIGAWTRRRIRGGAARRPWPRRRSALPGDALSRLHQDDARRCARHSRLFAHRRARARQDRREPTAIPVQHPLRYGGVERSELQARTARARSVAIRRVEPRTLSCRRARPLRHLSHAEDGRWAPTSDSAYLQGATLQGWFAPNITADERKGIGRWSIDEMVNYLKTGANRDAIASGGMGEEVVHSSSHMTDDDLKAIATYLVEPQAGVARHPQPLAAADARMVAGQAIYKDNCAGCHTDAGTGVSHLFPRLAGSHAVQSDDPTTLDPHGAAGIAGRGHRRRSDRTGHAQLRLAAQRRTGCVGAHVHSKYLGQCGDCCFSRSGQHGERPREEGHD